MNASPTLSTVSLWQPWASLLVHGAKRIETRAWKFSRQLPAVVAIHAARQWSREQEAIWNKLAVALHLPRGAVVGLVRVVACRPTGGRAVGQDETAWLAGLSEQERAFGDFSPGRFGWITDARFPLAEPIPLRGFQSVWQWAAPKEVLDIAAALAEVVLPAAAEELTP